MIVHIFYGNREVYSGEWLDAAQNRDVQIVIYNDPDTGWTLRHGAKGRSQCDFYREDGSAIVCMDVSGFIDYVTYELGMVEPGTSLPVMIHKAVHESGIIKQGKMLTTREWQNVYGDALRFREKLLADGPT